MAFIYFRDIREILFAFFHCILASWMKTAPGGWVHKVWDITCYAF